MEIIYGDKELKKCATDKSYALKKDGPTTGFVLCFTDCTNRWCF